MYTFSMLITHTTIIGMFSPPGDGMVVITLLTQVRKEKNGKINFHPGIEPGTQRLGVQYARHQAITQDKSLSPHSFLCIVYIV